MFSICYNPCINFDKVTSHPERITKKTNLLLISITGMILISPQPEKIGKGSKLIIKCCP